MTTSLDLEELKKMVCYYRQHPELEFEARFGHFVNGKFVVGVERNLIDKCLLMLQNSPSCVTKTDWQEHHDFYYMAEQDNVRTRVVYNTDFLNVKKSTIKKTKIMQKIFVIGNKEKPLNEKIGVRISLSEEIPYNHLIPIVTNTDHVRIQQRKQFCYGPWTYDFSLIWPGKNKTEAETVQRTENAIYEIEIELQSDYFIHHEDEYITQSFAMKILDFFDTKILTPL